MVCGEGGPNGYGILDPQLGPWACVPPLLLWDTGWDLRPGYAQKVPCDHYILRSEQYDHRFILLVVEMVGCQDFVVGRR